VFLIVVVWLFLSSGDFSFSLTCATCIQAFSFLGISVKMFSKKDASGLSLNTFICYALVFIGRLISILIYEGYLPFD
jgi:hypothetical protein